MNPIRRFLRRSIRRLRGRSREPPGLPLGVQVPADPVEHASQFALKWWDKLDEYAAVRIRTTRPWSGRRIRSCRSPRRRGSWRGRSGTGIASGGGATEEFRAAPPAFRGEAVVRLRSGGVAGDRVHDPGPGQLPVGLAVGIIDTDAIPLKVEAEQGDGLGRERDGGHGDILPGRSCWGGGAIEEFPAPPPAFRGEAVVRLRPDGAAGDRAHDPGPGQLAVRLAVGIIHAAVPLGEPASEQGQGLNRERDRGHGDLLLRRSYREGGGRGSSHLACWPRPYS